MRSTLVRVDSCANRVDATGNRQAGDSRWVDADPTAVRPHGGVVASSEAELLRTLHDQHAGALWAYAVNLTNGDRAKAQDVVQETMLRAWRNPQVLDQSGGSARGWLFTVARRIVIDDWRASRSRPEFVFGDMPEPAVADNTDQTVDRQLVLAALRLLSTEHREVLHECYFRGSSVAEAAKALGIPAGTVKSRTHYALRALRSALEDMGGVA
ncbi:MAG TPA: sigma-70 family RNA polymerase sigma factor [Jatrophihabitantaceae bacterium]|jgi:RNA polymerase sigma-70 factor (ECF subfamily)